MKKDLEGLVMVVLAKAVSAVENMGQVEETKTYKGIVKQEFKHFKNLYGELSRNLYMVYYDSNPKSFEVLVGTFDTLYYNGLPDVKQKMTLIYCKLESIKDDLSTVEFTDDQDIYTFYAVPVIALIDRLLTKKFWNNYLGEHHVAFTKMITEQGEKIYLEPEEETKE